MKAERFTFFSDVPDLTGFAWPDGGPEDVGDVTPPTSRVQVAKQGTFQHAIYGEFTIDAATFGAMIRNFEAGVPTDQLPVDFDHTPDYGGPSCACGWITGLEADGKALYATVQWNWDGAYAIRSNAYRYVSPTWSLNWVDESGAKRGPTLLAFGLTNRPFFTLPAVSLSRTFRAAELQPAVEVEGLPDSPARMEFHAQIAEVLGLAEDATEEEILTAARAALETPEEATAEEAEEATASEAETHARAEAEAETATEATAETAAETTPETDAPETHAATEPELSRVFQQQQLLDELRNAARPLLRSTVG